MNKTRFQKVNRAAVASVLAASGTVAVLPINDVKAASPFKDVDPAHFAYDAIINLYERNIISGYGNGRFGPNDSVTRGQAAKMLAQVLELDTTSIVNPNFKDVKTSDPFYPYIAALANEGVINGFIDQTYRPNEPITRGQMAIVIARGFDFKQATLPLTHTFDDVTVNTYERFFIQTIYDLGITKGKTERTFEPYSRVTRGEMAVFINRAENARAIANPVYEVTNVHTMGNSTYAYVNGVKHTVDSRLKNIFNEANAAALEGALIDGDITDTKRITSLSKITFTAKGSQGRSLQFNGRDSVFAGDVAITGSYLKFRNWSVTGEVSIEPETVRTIRAAIEASPFKRVASLGSPFGFIDWGQETDPDDYESIGGSGGNGDPWTGPADGSEDGTDLVSPPTGNETGYYKRMAPVQRHIEFIDMDVRYLVIRQTGTHISSTKELPHVTVERNVKAYEIYANVGTMYIDTDVNTTMYGISNIKEVYKNSHKSVNLDADTTIDLMIVDNSNGWIDLGEHAYIHTVIIPPNKMPNDIFNDFINDNDLIGNIEDPWGNEVDRDPIENTIVPDLEDPELRITNVEPILDTAKITFNSNEDGTLYYIVKKENDGEPSIREIIQNTGSRWAGRAAVSAGVDKIIEITQLDDETDYIIYAVVVDEAGNISDKTYEFFQITDAAAPVIRPVTATGLPGGKRIKVDFNPNETGEYFYYYTDAAFEPAEPVTTEVLMETLSKRPTGGSGKVTAAGLNSFTLTGLQHETDYVIYLVMKDEAGNVMGQPEVLRAKTTALDDIYPYVVDEELYLVDEETYEFEVFVNEALDPVSANDVNNYEISGTAIINVDGQPTVIKPDRVQYIEGQKKIRIRVPSATALVNGDTITLKILPGVKDLSENPFINIDVVENIEQVKNTASYIHDDSLKPQLTIENFQPNPLNTNAIMTYKANKAGTYYYMIIPNSYDMTGITPRQFYSEFTEEPMLAERIPQIAKQGDSGNNTVIVGSQSMNVALPTPPDPFESYTLYMVMKDRSGQLSSIEKVENVIDDSRAPFVRKLTVEPLEGYNTAVKLTISASEPGRVYYTRFEKNSTDQEVIDKIAEIRGWNTKLEQYKSNHALANDEDVKRYLSEIRTWKSDELKSDQLNVYTDRNLNPHTEYIYFVAVEDMFGNITMYPSTLTDAPTGNVTENYGEEIMMREVYTDGIDPFIEGDILRLITKNEFEKIPLSATSSTTGINDGYIEHISQQTFEITFSEAIKYSQATTSESLQELKAAIETVLNGVTITDIEWQDVSSIGTWQQRKLIFTLDKRPKADVIIDHTTLKDFTDLITRKFDDEKTNVRYILGESAGPNGLRDVVLDGDISTIGSVSSSTSILAALEINTRMDLEQTYYYIVETASASQPVPITPELIIKHVENNGRDSVLGGIPIYGKGKLAQDIEDSAQIGNSFVLSLRVTNPNSFQTGQRLYLITVDKYGTITESRKFENGISTGQQYDVIKTN